MRSVTRTAGLSSQTPRGAGARFFHRVGGAVRCVAAVAGALTRRRRRAETASPVRPSASQDTPPAPKRPRAPRRPRTEQPATPAPRSGWIARLFRRTPRPVAPCSPARRSAPTNAPFSPETHPGLSAAACALLNTPAKDLDPALLRLMLLGVSRHLAANIPPELGMDADALFAKMAGRLGVPVDEPPPAPAPAEPPQPPSAAPQEPVPDAPPAAPLSQAEPQVATADTPPAASPARAITPDGTVAVPSHMIGRRTHCHRRLSLLQTHRRDPHRPCRCRRPSRVFQWPHPAPPARRLTSAACAGPP